MSSVEAFRRLTYLAGASSRLRAGPGLTRLRAEARLIRRYPSEYRRHLPAGGHAEAVRHLVRKHNRQYDFYLLEAVLEHDRLFHRPNVSTIRTGGAVQRVAARAS
jgi:hypothetical protein